MSTSVGSAFRCSAVNRRQWEIACSGVSLPSGLKRLHGGSGVDSFSSHYSCILGCLRCPFGDDAVDLCQGTCRRSSVLREFPCVIGMFHLSRVCERRMCCDFYLSTRVPSHVDASPSSMYGPHLAPKCLRCIRQMALVGRRIRMIPPRAPLPDLSRRHRFPFIRMCPDPQATTRLLNRKILLPPE